MRRSLEGKKNDYGAERYKVQSNKNIRSYVTELCVKGKQDCEDNRKKAHKGSS